MKFSHSSLRRVPAILPSLFALIGAVGACGGGDDATPPSSTTPDASTTPDTSTTTPDTSATTPDVQTPRFDAGTMTCGTVVCTGSIVGGQTGRPCCPQFTPNACGLDFGQGCVDQSDAFSVPMFD